MENQGNFLTTNPNFGIQSTASVTDDVADLIFGGGPTVANPKDVKPLDTPTLKNIEPKKEEDKDEPETIEISTDEFLDDLNSNIEKKDNTKTEVKKEEPKDEVVEVEDDNTFNTLSKNLVDLGIFTQAEAEELPKTAEEFKDKWLAERQSQVNTDIYNFLISKHGEEGLRAFEDIFVKGVAPKDYLSKFAEVQSFKDIDLTVESNQERVVRESLRRQGLKEEIIDKKVQKLKDYGDLEEESGIAHELILNQDENELQNIASQKEQENQAREAARLEYSNKLQTILSNSIKQKDIDGIPVTDKVAREVFDMLTTEKWQLPSGEKLTDFDKELLELRNPENINLKLKLALLLRNKLDFSKIKTNLVSRETNKLFEDLVIKDKQIKRTKPVSGGSFFEGLNK